MDVCTTGMLAQLHNAMEILLPQLVKGALPEVSEVQ
jgi:hypothetical protein